MHTSNRCIKKLQECNGDVGVALEQLLGDFLQIDLDGGGAEGDPEDTATAAEEMKNDEKMALGRILHTQSVNSTSR